MKKYLFIFCLLLLSNCAQNSALLGPSYTLASSGSIFEAGASLSASYGLKKGEVVEVCPTIIDKKGKFIGNVADYPFKFSKVA